MSCTTRPVTQVALVAVNSASSKLAPWPSRVANGSVSRAAPARISARKPKMMMRAGVRRRVLAIKPLKRYFPSRQSWLCAAPGRVPTKRNKSRISKCAVFIKKAQKGGIASYYIRFTEKCKREDTPARRPRAQGLLYGAPGTGCGHACLPRVRDRARGTNKKAGRLPAPRLCAFVRRMAKDCPPRGGRPSPDVFYGIHNAVGGLFPCACAHWCRNSARLSSR